MVDPPGATRDYLAAKNVAHPACADESHDLKPTEHHVTASEAAYSALFIMTTLTAAWYGLTAIIGVIYHDRANFGDFAYAYHHAVGNTFIAYLFTRIYAIVHLIDEKAHDDYLICSLPKLNAGVERLCRLAAILWVIVVFKPYEPLLKALKGFPYLQSSSLWFGDLTTRLSFALADSRFGKALFDNNAIAYINIEKFHNYEVEYTYVKSTVGLALMIIILALIIWDLSVFVFNIHNVDEETECETAGQSYHDLWMQATKPLIPLSLTQALFEWAKKQVNDTQGVRYYASCLASIVVRLALYLFSWKFIDRLVLLFIAAIISRSDYQILLPVSALFPFLALFTVATGVYLHRTFLTQFFDLLLSPAIFVTGSGYGKPVGGILIFAAIFWLFNTFLYALTVAGLLLLLFVALSLIRPKKSSELDKIPEQQYKPLEMPHD